MADGSLLGNPQKGAALPGGDAPAQPAAPALSGDAAKLAVLTERLQDIISRETALMQAHRIKDAQKLHTEKNRLIMEYRDTSHRLRVNHSQLPDDKNNPQRRYLRAITDGFRETLNQHARMVLRMKTVSEGLIRSISEEVTRKNRPVIGYNSGAAVALPTSIKPTSLRLNQTV